MWIKDPDPVFSRIRIRETQKVRIRPDPDPHHWAKPGNDLLKYFVKSLLCRNCIFLFGKIFICIYLLKFIWLRLQLFLSDSSCSCFNHFVFLKLFVFTFPKLPDYPRPWQEFKYTLFKPLSGIHFINSVIYPINSGGGIQRHVVKTNLSIWLHCVEQVSLVYNHNKSQHRVRLMCLSSRGGEGEKGNLFVTF